MTTKQRIQVGSGEPVVVPLAHDSIAGLRFEGEFPASCLGLVGFTCAKSFWRKSTRAPTARAASIWRCAAGRTVPIRGIAPGPSTKARCMSITITACATRSPSRCERMVRVRFPIADRLPARSACPSAKDRQDRDTCRRSASPQAVPLAVEQSAGLCGMAEPGKATSREPAVIPGAVALSR